MLIFKDSDNVLYFFFVDENNELEDLDYVYEVCEDFEINYDDLEYIGYAYDYYSLFDILLNNGENHNDILDILRFCNF